MARFVIIFQFCAINVCVGYGLAILLGLGPRRLRDAWPAGGWRPA